MSAMDIPALRVALANGFLNRRSQVQFLPGAPASDTKALDINAMATRQTRQTQPNASARSLAQSSLGLFAVHRDSTAAQSEGGA